MIFPELTNQALRTALLTAALALLVLPAKFSLAEELSESTKCEKYVRQISVVVLDVFDNPRNSLYSSANSLKVNTREKVVRRELLLKKGHCFSPFLLEESERALRSLKYLRNVHISSHEEGDQVDLLVSVQDTWTFIPQIGYNSTAGSRQASAGLSEGNILGQGKRGEFLYLDDNGRRTLEGVYDDNRLLGSDYRLLGGWFDRDDGQRYIGVFGRPFRSLLDTNSWSTSVDSSDTIGRLFQYGDERYIYRQRKNDLGLEYTFARGDPERNLRRYSFGWDFREAAFEQANDYDYRQLDLDPDSISATPPCWPGTAATMARHLPTSTLNLTSSRSIILTDFRESKTTTWATISP